MVAFTAYLGMLYGPLSALTNARMDLATSLVSFERVFEVIDLPLEIAERPEAKALKSVRGHVRFDKVSFSYQPDDGAEEASTAGLAEVVRFGGPRSPAMTAPPLSQEGGKLKKTGARAKGGSAAPQAPAERSWALRDIGFEIRPGQLAALVGPSGSGKTTVTYLLPRFYDPTEGAVSIDGHDLRDLTLATLSEQIGMVTQETFLFNDTIRANLLYAKPKASPADIEAACRAANIHDFIAGLPEGYDTV
ncbi:MAG: ABC transporter ATP-binding protein, partial [Candidatus Aminicenantes bacterium]